MSHRYPRTIASLALALSCLTASLVRTTASAATADAAVTPSRVSTVGTLRVERYGSGSPAMIFIPGLSCGSWVWHDAIARYASSHALYLVTLAGFDGVPAASGAPIDGADASLLDLITTEKLDRPIVVGHSLGGYLALRFGTEHAALVRGVIAVDGLPILPPFAQMTAAQRDATADGIAAKMSSASPAEFVAGQKKTLATMITSDADVDRVAKLTATSDPKAVTAYASALYRADLRPELVKLTVPTLEIAPVPTVPAAYEGPDAAKSSMADRRAGYASFYRSLFPGAPNVVVETVPDSKHFVMIDRPDALYDDITAFVATLGA